MRTRNLKNETLDNLIIALCLDYSRRKKLIEEGMVGKRCLVEFRYLNIKIYDAVAEIVGDGLAEIYIEELGKNVGYAKSRVMDELSEATYKKYKLLIKENIAKKLHLSG